MHNNNEKGNINFQGKTSGKYISVRTSVLKDFFTWAFACVCLEMCYLVLHSGEGLASGSFFTALTLTRVT